MIMCKALLKGHNGTADRSTDANYFESLKYMHA